MDETGHCMKNEGAFGVDYYTRAQGRNTFGIDVVDGALWSLARLLDLVCGLVWLWAVGLYHLGAWSVCTRRCLTTWGYSLVWYGLLLDGILLLPKVLLAPIVWLTSPRRAPSEVPHKEAEPDSGMI